MAKLRIVPYLKDREDTLYLRLDEDEDGVILRAVYSNGEYLDDGSILTINENGITRCHGVSRSLGLPVNDYGCVDFCSEV